MLKGMKRVLSITMAVLFVLSILMTGCSKTDDKSKGQQSATTAPAAKKEVVTITFWDENAGPDRTPYLQKYIEKFHQKQSDVKVEYVGLPSTEAVNKYNVAIAGNAVPDCGGVYDSWLAGFVAQKALAKLDERFAAWSDSKNFDPSAVASLKKKDPAGGLYLIPMRQNNSVIWYRKDWFKEAGIPDVVTFKDFFSAVEKVTDTKKGRYGFSIRGGDGGGTQMEKMLLSYVGTDYWFDKDGKQITRLPEAEEFMIKFANMYNKFTPASDITNGYKEMVAAFDSGTVAMIQHNLGSLGEHTKALKPDQFGAWALPKSDSKGRWAYTVSSSSGYGMLEGSKKKEASWEWLKYLTSEEINSEWTKQIGEMPSRLDVMKNHDWVKNSPSLNSLSKALTDPKTVLCEEPTYLPEFNSLQKSVVEPGLQAVLLGKKTPKVFLEEWSNAIEKSKAEYDKAYAKKK